MSRHLTAQDILDHTPFGIVGIDAEGDVYGGYDEQHEAARMAVKNLYPDDDEPCLTAEERIKLADEMIARWTRYREAATSDRPT